MLNKKNNLVNILLFQNFVIPLYQQKRYRIDVKLNIVSLIKHKVMKIFSNNQDSEIIISINRDEIIEFASAFASKICEFNPESSSSIIREIYNDAVIKRDAFLELYFLYKCNKK